MTIPIIIIVLGIFFLYGGIKGLSITHLLLGDNSTPRTPPAGGSNSTTYQDPTGTSAAGDPSNPTGNKLGSGILNSIGKIIGLPYQGTHSRSLNIRGGSNNWQSENAVDIALPVGTPVFSPVAGTVVRAGDLPGNPGGRFAGERVTVQGADNAFYFMHLSSVSVSVGQKIKAGTQLGLSGSANGVAHLHFAVENGSPLDWLKARVSKKT